MSVPALVGGFSLRQYDLAPAIIFAAAYALVAGLLFYRLWKRESRTLTVLEVASFASERMAVFALRAVAAAVPSFESTGLTKYLQLTLALGYLTLAHILSKVIRVLLVNSTNPPSYDQPEDSNTLLVPAPDPHDARRRAIFRNINLLQLLPYFTAMILAILQTRRDFTDPETAANRAEQYAAAALSLFLIASEVLTVLWARWWVPPAPINMRAVNFLTVTTALLILPAVYRLTLFHQNTPDVKSLTHAALNTPRDKAAFYILHVLPEWLIAALVSSVNIKELCGTGMWGDLRSRDETPAERERRWEKQRAKKAKARVAEEGFEMRDVPSSDLPA
ncbi:hypothetical protein C8F01DRAFT_1274809 [Mycena amicta]|nr:hypothetical protein C8F01DRAFT_1274809 [Mycena amicta]